MLDSRPLTRAKLVALFAFSLLASCLVFSSAQAQFPAIALENLEGENTQFPTQLAGTKNLVILAFKQRQQEDVNTWFPLAGQIAATRPDFAYYEVPTLGRRFAMMRGFIDGGMRRGIADINARRRTYTFWGDKPALKRTLGIDSEETIWLYLIDRSGRVLWRQRGLYNQAKARSLMEALN